MGDLDFKTSLSFPFSLFVPSIFIHCKLTNSLFFLNQLIGHFMYQKTIKLGRFCISQKKQSFYNKNPETKMRTIVLLLFLSLVSVSLAGDCNNPLGSAQGVTLNAEPAAATGTCAETVLGGTSCCSQTYHDELGNLMTELLTKYSTTANYYPALMSYIDDFMDLIVSAATEKMSGIDYSSDSDGSSTSTDTTSSSTDTSSATEYDPYLITVTTSEWESTKASFATDMVTCHQKLFNLGSAMTCLACDPEYSSYMRFSGDNIEISVAEASCTALRDACSTHIKGMDYMLTKFASAVVIIFWTELVLALSDPNYTSSLSTDSEEDYVGEDSFEVHDLLFTTEFGGTCDISNGYSSANAMEDYIGPYGPSVYLLMIQSQAYNEYVDQCIAWANGDSNAFSRRRFLEEIPQLGPLYKQIQARILMSKDPKVEKMIEMLKNHKEKMSKEELQKFEVILKERDVEKSPKQERKLEGEKSLTIGFNENDFDIVAKSSETGTTVTVVELFSLIQLAFGLLSLICWIVLAF